MNNKSNVMSQIRSAKGTLKKTKEKEVYCSECRFFVIVPVERCEAPENKKEIAGNYYGKSTRYNSEPRHINTTNKCQWFKSRPWWQRLIKVFR